MGFFTVNYTALISKIWEDGNNFCYIHSQIISAAFDRFDVLDLKELTQKVSVQDCVPKMSDRLSINSLRPPPSPDGAQQSYSGWDTCNKIMKIWK